MDPVCGTQDCGTCDDGYSCKDGECEKNPCDTTENKCDGKDNDCDGLRDEADEADPEGCTEYYKDEDGDTYGTDESKCLCAAEKPFDATRGGDCCDSDDRAKPGQEIYFTDRNRCEYWDYDCNRTDNLQYTSVGKCNGSPCDKKADIGWVGTVPGCGETGTFLTTCYYDWGCEEETEQRTQGCK